MSSKRTAIRHRRQQQQLHRTFERRRSAGLFRRKLWFRDRWLNLMRRRYPWLAEDTEMKTQQELFD